MNLNSPELTVSVEQLQNNLAEGVSLSAIVKAFDIPTNNTFYVAATGLLPSNLSTFDEEGILHALPKTTLEETLSANLNSMSGLVKDNIKTSMVNAISVESQISRDSQEQLIENLSTQIQNSVDSVVSEVQKFIINANKFVEDNLVLSNFNKVISELIKEKVDGFSNKQIRDLNDNSEYFDFILEQIYSESIYKLKDTVEEELKKYITPSSSVTSAINTSTINFKTSPYDISVYVRNYYTYGQGADPDTFAGLTVTNRKLISGKTCAVDNSTILLNSVITMPDGRKFNAVDSFVGSAVRPAIYLYFEKRSDADNYLNSLGVTLTNKIKVNVIPPERSDKIPTFDKPTGTNISIRGLSKDLV